MDQARLVGIGTRAGRALDQREVVVLLAEAEERDAALGILGDHLEPNHARIEFDRRFQVAHVHHHVAQSYRFDHWFSPFTEAIVGGQSQLRSLSGSATMAWRVAPVPSIFNSSTSPT